MSMFFEVYVGFPASLFLFVSGISNSRLIAFLIENSLYTSISNIVMSLLDSANFSTTVDHRYVIKLFANLPT